MSNVLIRDANSLPSDNQYGRLYSILFLKKNMYLSSISKIRTYIKKDNNEWHNFSSSTSFGYYNHNRIQVLLGQYISHCNAFAPTLGLETVPCDTFLLLIIRGYKPPKRFYLSTTFFFSFQLKLEFEFYKVQHVVLFELCRRDDHV